MFMRMVAADILDAHLHVFLYMVQLRHAHSGGLRLKVGALDHKVTTVYMDVQGLLLALGGQRITSGGRFHCSISTFNMSEPLL
jgi:hypothetical protein